MTIMWHQYFELFSLLCALVFARGLNSFGIAVLIPLLLLDNVTEIIGINFVYFGWKDNYFVYSLYLVLSTPLVLWLFGSMLRRSAPKNPYFVAVAIAIQGFVLINYCFIQGRFEFDTYSYLLVATAEIVLCCLVLARLAIGKDDQSDLLRDPYFWINGTTLLFNLVSLILLGALKFIALNHLEIRHKNLYLAILPAANALLYTGYSYAFLLCHLQARK
jgi:hypothetical protein